MSHNELLVYMILLSFMDGNLCCTYPILLQKFPAFDDNLFIVYLDVLIDFEIAVFGLTVYYHN